MLQGSAKCASHTWLAQNVCQRNGALRVLLRPSPPRCRSFKIGGLFCCLRLSLRALRRCRPTLRVRPCARGSRSLHTGPNLGQAVDPARWNPHPFHALDITFLTDAAKNAGAVCLDGTPAVRIKISCPRFAASADLTPLLFIPPRRFTFARKQRRASFTFTKRAAAGEFFSFAPCLLQPTYSFPHTLSPGANPTATVLAAPRRRWAAPRPTPT